MKLEELLKQLQRIEADRSYVQRSRSTILEEYKGVSSLFRNPFRTILKSLELGSAIALAGLLLVVILGGFSAWKFLSPFSVQSLDPESLRAEAQAIDIQIHLTEISYSEPFSTSPFSQETTTVALPSIIGSPKQSTEVPPPEPSSSHRAPMTIDEALDVLSK